VFLATYILVFNLNSLIKASQARYLHFKGNVVEEMMNDSRSAWVETGMKFNMYKPMNAPKESKPSEWWVLVYQVLRIFRPIGISKSAEFIEGNEAEKVDSRDDSVSSTDRSSNGDSSDRRWWWRLFHRRDIKRTGGS
jgi:hypothetical protein